MQRGSQDAPIPTEADLLGDALRRDVVGIRRQSELGGGRGWGRSRRRGGTDRVIQPLAAGLRAHPVAEHADRPGRSRRPLAARREAVIANVRSGAASCHCRSTCGRKRRPSAAVYGLGTSSVKRDDLRVGARLDDGVQVRPAASGRRTSSLVAQLHDLPV